MDEYPLVVRFWKNQKVIRINLHPRKENPRRLHENEFINGS